MALLTKQESLEAYDRIRYGKRAMSDSLLSHTMLAKDGNLRNWYSLDEKMGNKATVAYRLVSRGLVTTVTQFNRVCKQILRG